MDFRSDNVTGAHPTILEAVVAANRGPAGGYGADAHTHRATDRLSELFEREVAVFPVATGTAANALSLALLSPPWGVIYCHAESHVQLDECGAPELFSGGAKLVPVAGAAGKLTPAGVETAIHGEGFVHAPQPAAVSVSQATEAGTVYRVDEIAALAEVARRHRMGLHMDGSRFANALVSTGVTPAEMTWKAGVDVLSFGGTKNGCLAAEAVVLFDGGKATEMGYRRKRAGQLLSKMRFVSAQLEAYLAGDLWLSNATHANAMAARLASGFTSGGIRPCVPVEANEVFVILPAQLAFALRGRGFSFYDWPTFGPGACRFVTAFDTRLEDVEALVTEVARWATGTRPG
jgi:threonine aldolase